MHPKQVPILIALSMTLAFAIIFSIFVESMVDSPIDRLAQALAVVATALCGVFVGIYIPRSSVGDGTDSEASEVAILSKRVDTLIREVSVSTLDESSIVRQIAHLKAHTSNIMKVLAYHVSDPGAPIAIDYERGSVKYSGPSSRRKSPPRSQSSTAAPAGQAVQPPTGSKQ